MKACLHTSAAGKCAKNVNKIMQYLHQKLGTFDGTGINIAYFTHVKYRVASYFAILFDNRTDKMYACCA